MHTHFGKHPGDKVLCVWFLMANVSAIIINMITILNICKNSGWWDAVYVDMCLVYVIKILHMHVRLWLVQSD